MTETVVHVTTLEQWKSVLDVCYKQGHYWLFTNTKYQESIFENGGRFLFLDDYITWSASNYNSEPFIEYSEFMAQQKEDNKMALNIVILGRYYTGKGYTGMGRPEWTIYTIPDGKYQETPKQFTFQGLGYFDHVVKDLEDFPYNDKGYAYAYSRTKSIEELKLAYLDYLIDNHILIYPELLDDPDEQINEYNRLKYDVLKGKE